jgi:hypothetical protein
MGEVSERGLSGRCKTLQPCRYSEFLVSRKTNTPETRIVTAGLEKEREAGALLTERGSVSVLPYSDRHLCLLIVIHILDGNGPSQPDGLVTNGSSGSALNVIWLAELAPSDQSRICYSGCPFPSL